MVNRNWEYFAIVVTLIAVLLAGAVCIAVIVIQANSAAVQRYTLLCTSDNITTTTTAMGMLQFDSSAGTISWDIRYTNVADIPLAVYINGPTPIGFTIAPLDIALCGSPAPLVCDTSIVGLLSGSIVSYNGAGLKTYITAIRYYPVLYYVEVIFNTGSVKCPIGQSAGY